MDSAERGQQQPLSTEELHEVVALAALAPSVHNTQPWRFRWDGTALSVLEDPTRGLPVLDPNGYVFGRTGERPLSKGSFNDIKSKLDGYIAAIEDEHGEFDAAGGALERLLHLLRRATRKVQQHLLGVATDAGE